MQHQVGNVKALRYRKTVYVMDRFQRLRTTTDQIICAKAKMISLIMRYLSTHFSFTALAEKII